MARQNGILKIKGTIGGMTFYKSQDGDLVREKGGVDASRIANDPAFARTRENGAEFGEAGTAGKLLRDSLRSMMMNASDGRVTSRITQKMTEILKLDGTSVRGSRTVAVGLTDPAASGMLKGFDFNVNAILKGILFKKYEVDMTTGTLTIGGLVPINDIAYPAGATHVTLTGALAVVDFALGESDLELTNSANLVINAAASDLQLVVPTLPTIAGTKFFLLKLEFFQVVNGQQYGLKNGAYNALAIVEIA